MRAAYRYTVERCWKEEYEETDSSGYRARQTRAGSDTVAGNERRAPFSIHDDMGQIVVVPDGTKLRMETTLDRFERGDLSGQPHLGAFQLTFWGSEGSRCTAGCHHHEEVMPLGRLTYLLGAAMDTGGRWSIVRPSAGHGPFLVSPQTRDQVMRSARETTAYALYGVYACAPLGLLLIILGLVSRS